MSVIHSGEVIIGYPDDKPYPSYLLLGYIDKQPLHVVMSKIDTVGSCLVITVYKPSPNQWQNNFRTRK